MSAMQNTITSATSRRPWNKGKLVGPKAAIAAQARLGNPDEAANAAKGA